ncbi:HAMP domain-containing sensor histidine kinase [Flectobacillus longus]|uniref:HAMP domain-containing sensor histidine kinase n=1 Tax=Flectobacillus longus TaxID=2984207 RepID=UPI0024B72091|nr:HAMP domain-containing sensor histidine kinase [Flectobacillus longus]MDI9880616.1 HAMP domain-containing sensor histidine kinase [Flectobacillus longus]
MTIRTRLIVMFSSIVVALLVLFSTFLYWEEELHRQTIFSNRLKHEGLTSAEALFGNEKLSPQLLKLLDKNQMTVLDKEEVVIFDKNKKILYESGTDYFDIPAKRLDEVIQNGEIYWQVGQGEIFGFRYNIGKKELLIFSSAVDIYGLSKQRNLAIMLITGCLLTTLVVFFAGWFFAGRVLQPINRIIKQLDTITASNMDLRLDEGNRTDEIAQLSLRFNQMLERLQKAFRLQKSFVAHASHELRTPLTAITGQIQVSLLANDSPEELKAMIQSVLEDVQQLNKLANGLLDIASMDSNQTPLKYNLVNLTELLWSVRQELTEKKPEYEVLLFLEQERDMMPELYAHEALLYTALINLIENGAKFSDNKTVSVKIECVDNGAKVSVHNTGKTISEKEIQEIFEPFKRGSNARNTPGHGVGLSLVKKIVELHQGQIQVESSESQGTTFTVCLPYKFKSKI